MVFAGDCGNGILEGGEECDPGGELVCNGDPSQGTCITGANCPGSTNCYFALGCCKFNCQFVGQGATCFDGNTCTEGDHCDNVGRCIGQFKADDSPCDDGIFCNGTDSCQTGACDGHAGDPCAGATDCLSTCVEASDSCVSTPLVPCGDDGNSCTDDVCNASGVCTHPPLAVGTVCRPVATVCDLPEVCSGGGAPCPANAFLVDGTPCGDLCTTNGTCQSGSCVGGMPLVCDDNNVCNGLETCDSLTGCQPGTPLDCDDGESCTADPCAPIGGCSHTVLPDGTACDDGEHCTIIDVCTSGVCQGLTPNFLVRSNSGIGPGASVAGHLAVNELRGSARLGQGAVMTDGSLLTADGVLLGPAASVFDVEANTLRGPSAVIRGTVGPATLPVVPTWCTMPSGSCGGTDVLVDEAEVVRITPGSYGTVSLSKRGTLELDPGTYEFCGLNSRGPSAIRARGNVIVRIRGNVRAGKLGLIEPFAGTTQIWVAGRMRIGHSSEVRGAAVMVPSGSLNIGRLSKFDGALCSDRLRASQGVRLSCPLP